MATKAATNTPNSELAKSNGFSTQELRGIATFEDVQALFAAHEIAVVDASEEIGDGFALTDNKDQFIGRELLLLSWVFGQGDFGPDSEFAAVRFVLKEANGTVGKYVITDGGTGIYRQLKDYTVETGVTGGMYVKKGFRKSEYSNEHTEHGVTHYLDLSK